MQATFFTVTDDTIFASKAELGLSQSQYVTIDSGLLQLGTSSITADDGLIDNQTTANLFII